MHDFSAAGWLFATVLLWSILRRKNLDMEIHYVMVGMLKTVSLLMQLSLVGIVVFGTVRAIAYRSYEWNEAAGQNQIMLLVVKHVIFTLLFVPGVFFYIRAKRLVGKARNEKAI
jgi:hypothetical protein